MKRIVLFCLLLIVAVVTEAQKMKIITPDRFRIDIEIVSDSIKKNIIHEWKGKQDNTLRKQFTARTYRLSDNRILIEFYDGQAALVKGRDDFNRLREARFAKNYIDFLKKDVTYKIELPFQKGLELSRSAHRIDSLKPTLSEYYHFDVYELQTGQILFNFKSDNITTSTIYENMKGLCSDNGDILHQFYKGMDAWTEKLVNGDPLLDYEIDGHLVYPKDIPALVKNHQLSLIESKIYVNEFYGNLYKSGNGYYVLIDDENQKNGAGNKMLILTVRIYEHLQDVRNAQWKYEKFKYEAGTSVHFYQQISDKFGKNFPLYTQRLIDSLPSVLNIDKEQLTLDSAGMAIVDEAIRWHHANYKLFDRWFPLVLAYYGQCYMKEKGEGKWVVRKERDDKVWVPHLVLSNNREAFDVYDFYKDLFEWPHSIKDAGDWDGRTMGMRKQNENRR